MTDLAALIPDTRRTPMPPGDQNHLVCRWLAGRSPVLPRLLARIPGVLSSRGPGEIPLDRYLLVDVVGTYDHRHKCLEQHDRVHRRPEPRWDEDDGQYEARCEPWTADAGGARPPELADAVREFAVMSGTEQLRLRMLAVLGGYRRVEISADDLCRLDDEGRCWAAAWLRAIAAVGRVRGGHAGPAAR